jgi:hypothetical protein
MLFGYKATLVRSPDPPSARPGRANGQKGRKRGIHWASLLIRGATTVLRDIVVMLRPQGDVMEDPPCPYRNVEMSHTSKALPLTFQ